jgi:hypothetical protein
LIFNLPFFMKKAVVILFVVCYGLFVLFTRQPDFFDAEFTVGKVKIENSIPYIFFTEYGKEYKIKNDHYYWMSLKQNEEVKIIYSVANPNEAAYYTLFSYWFLWHEILISLIVFIILFLGAVSINKNPEVEN